MGSDTRKSRQNVGLRLLLGCDLNTGEYGASTGGCRVWSSGKTTRPPWAGLTFPWAKTPQEGKNIVPAVQLRGHIWFFKHLDQALTQVHL